MKHNQMLVNGVNFQFSDITADTSGIKRKELKQTKKPAEAVHFAPIPVENALWTATDVGKYLKVSTYTTQTKVVHKPGFPTPIVPAGGEKRWFAGEVINWAKQQRVGS